MRSFEDDYQKTFSSRKVGITWRKNMGKVYVTLDCKKTGATDRKKAESIAIRLARMSKFPAFSVIKVIRPRIANQLCLVIGEVKT